MAMAMAMPHAFNTEMRPSIGLLSQRCKIAHTKSSKWLTTVPKVRYAQFRCQGYEIRYSQLVGPKQNSLKTKKRKYNKIKLVVKVGFSWSY